MENIEEYYKKYGAMVYKRCLEMLKIEDKALDAMQDVFARLLTFNRKIKYPSSFLYRAATNMCLNHLRNDASTSELGEAGFIASNEDLEESFIVRERLSSIFSGEKKSSRVIAYMRFIDKMTIPQIAHQMQMSESGVKKRLSKLRHKSLSLQNEERGGRNESFNEKKAAKKPAENEHE